MKKQQLTFIVLSMLLAACSTTPKSSATSAVPAQTSQASAATPAGTASKQVAAMDSTSQALESIYFDTDRSDVTSQFKDAVKRQADWMMAHKGDIVTVQGNTDERGSNEYNLGLGHRRATAAHRMLAAMGIPAKRIKDVSFGKEKPKASCHEEKCWEQNRRVDFAHSQS